MCFTKVFFPLNKHEQRTVAAASHQRSWMNYACRLSFISTSLLPYTTKLFAQKPTVVLFLKYAEPVLCILACLH